MCGAQLAFKGVGPLPMAAIKRARADLEGAADAEARAHQRRLDALCAASQVHLISLLPWGSIGLSPVAAPLWFEVATERRPGLLWLAAGVACTGWNRPVCKLLWTW